MNEHARRLMARHTINVVCSIREALKAINDLSGESMTLFVISSDGTLEGTVTDGDIRRGLIAGSALDDSVSRVMHRKFLAASPSENLTMLIAEGRRRRISLLPVVDEGRIIDILDLRTLRTSLPIDAVLMAGGKGERLRPLTLDTPKPLLKVGGKSIIDYNVEELESCGVKDIFVTVNYLADQIEEHFAGRSGYSNVTCVREPKRLGTMGSLALVEGLKHDNVLLMNSDLLTNLDFEAMYLHHVNSSADITIAAVAYNVSVPYALMRLENGLVKGLEEKPTYNYFANGGVYLIRRPLLQRLKKGEYTDAPDFISRLIDEGGEVGCFPIDGTWIDIGSPDDYRYANELMSHKLGER